jgi:two-component system cell cycle response regulator
MSPARNSRLKVLVIDDDISMLGLLKLRLEKAGYQVLLAENGIAAGQLALSAAPNLILVDVDMPYWNGYGLVQRLKADPVTRHIPMVFLTADQQMDERILQLGADACLRKPLKLDRLLKVVALFATAALGPLHGLGVISR